MSHPRPGHLKGFQIPLLETLRTYPRVWLRQDLIAGLTVWVVMIPSVIPYAELVLVSAQLGKLVGIKLKGEDFFLLLHALVSDLGRIHVPTLVFGWVLIAPLGQRRQVSRHGTGIN